MDKLEQLKEQLKTLSPEDVEQLKAFLNTEPYGETEGVEDTSKSNEVENEGKTTPAETTPEGTNEEVPGVETEKTEESTPTEPTKEETETGAEEVKTEDAPAEITKDGIVAPAEPTPAPINTEDIPAMQKGGEVVEEQEQEVPKLTSAEDGQELPIDYEQVIDGLNAKVAALEAENAGLKSKVDGAFGYSSKPAMPTKVNRLYDECENIQIHK